MYCPNFCSDSSLTFHHWPLHVFVTYIHDNNFMDGILSSYWLFFKRIDNYKAISLAFALETQCLDNYDSRDKILFWDYYNWIDFNSFIASHILWYNPGFWLYSTTLTGYSKAYIGYSRREVGLWQGFLKTLHHKESVSGYNCCFI